MAIEFNITAADKFFLGEDKVIELTIFELDGTTPFDLSALPLEWKLRTSDAADDPALITKGITAGGVSTGIAIIGIWNVDPAVNTQRVRITFASADTDPLVTTDYTLKAGRVYRHSLKRMDAGNEGILSYGSMTFLQATER